MTRRRLRGQPTETDRALWELFKMALLARIATCDDCSGDVTVSYSARTATWQATTHHSPHCPYRHTRGDTDD